MSVITTCPTSTAFAHDFGQAQQRPAEHRVRSVAILTLVVMFAEIFTGIWSGSMSLLADGVHMGTHALALGLAAFAYSYSRRHAQDRRFSLGTGKIGELAGYSSALLLIFSAFFLVVESVERLLSPRAIAFQETLVVAFIGLAVNVVSAFWLGGHDHAEVGHGHDHHHGHDHEAHGHEDHNHRAAFVHVLADALTSVAAIAALFGAWKLGWNWLDPVVAMVASGVILVWGFGLIRNTGRVLLDSEAPEHERQEVLEALQADGDTRVTDLHIWSVGPGAWTLVASVVTHSDRNADDYRKLLADDIHHPIIEVVRCKVCT